MPHLCGLRVPLPLTRVDRPLAHAKEHLGLEWLAPRHAGVTRGGEPIRGRLRRTRVFDQIEHEATR